MVRFPGPFPFSLQLSAAVPDVGVAVTVEIEESLATDVVTVVAGARLVGGETLNALTGLLKLLAAVDFAFVMPVDVVVVVVVVVFEDVDLVV